MKKEMQHEEKEKDAGEQALKKAQEADASAQAALAKAKGLLKWATRKHADKATTFHLKKRLAVDKKKTAKAEATEQADKKKVEKAERKSCENTCEQGIIEIRRSRSAVQEGCR